MTYDKLSALAADTVRKVMREGELTYPANDFMDRPISEHYDHASDHILSYAEEFCTNPREELEHALTRIVIILAKMKLEEGKCKDVESLIRQSE